ncbi:low temperature requirement protein A [Micromonospora halotolerans]|uniref:Low temperature requirement protein A n=1 Tax=Micromonospora halotolerans TaxID=709879 RepID=A0ABY9ZV04_9ACTN|nr:low temperature requirement protein A [Micromonospora halotolerans]WNM39129.1 low temperature requirement protein A [Micromonospora halotolerans]
MKTIFRSRPIMTEETHRATSFEIFFDLVFVFALTRIISFMGRPPTFLTMAQGLVLLLLLWIAWTNYTWLGNLVRADVGLVPAGTIVAMAAIFVTALVIPNAWRHGNGIVDAPVILALAYIVQRVLHLALAFHVAAGDRQLRTTLRLYMTTAILAGIPLLLGAAFHGTAQTLLWAGAFAIEFSGGVIASALSGWRLRSPSHFTERHGLVLIIALGESLMSVGTGAELAVTRGPVLLAALFAFTNAVCLWRLYFKNTAIVAGHALETVPSGQRGRLATNAYSLAHFPLIAGVIYTALGIEQVLDHLAHGQPWHTTPSLDWASTVALYGGVILYCAGRVLFLRPTGQATPRKQIVATCVVLLLLPAARSLPALAALGLLTAFLVALVCYEQLSGSPRNQRAGEVTPA